jgi:DNA (cytosine-5)-methyltransferase 1
VNVYYNEHEPFAADWLGNLGAAGHIPAGTVDRRSIVDVEGADLDGVDQAHFFAGIGGWPLALRLAGLADLPCWTGSCPCQPFSSAGKRRGTDDERHLWPEFRRLIGECRPRIVFGEQVASRAGRAWLAAVRSDLEGMGYAVGAADLCAAGVGAPHIRQRLYWGAVIVGPGRMGHADETGRNRVSERDGDARPGEGREPGRERAAVPSGLHADGSRDVGGVADAEQQRAGGNPADQAGPADARSYDPGSVLPAARESCEPRGPWGDIEWLPCRDGKWRPTQPGLFPLAHGIPARVGRLRGYGNAIVPQVAAAFVTAFMGAVAEREAG